MPSHLHTSSRVIVNHVSSDRGGQRVLDDALFVLSGTTRLGVVGPNGVGKSTLLSIMCGQLEPDSGSVTVEPALARVGLLDQEPSGAPEESVRNYLRRTTQADVVEAALFAAADDLAANLPDAARTYERALARFESSEVATFDARCEVVLREVGVDVELSGHPFDALSGGQKARVALAAIMLSRFEVTLPDEPTNGLDFQGLDLLERWFMAQNGPVVGVSHDRSFLERVVTDVLEIDEATRRTTWFAGGWSQYEQERANQRRQAREAFERYDTERRVLIDRARRQREWSAAGVRKEKRHPRDNDKAQRDFRINRTQNNAQRARRIVRAVERLEVVERPFEGWDLRLSLAMAPRSGDVVARLDHLVVTRGDFTLGPVQLIINWADRIGIAGANSAGKSTLIKSILGQIIPTSGTRMLGTSVVVGLMDQDRTDLSSEESVESLVARHCNSTRSDTRALLAKFGLGARDVTRASSTLSPGERTRARLALFQGRGVNLLVLDEPTNHLDLPAIEQLESAIATFEGTLILVSHDRRLLDTVTLTRQLVVSNGRVSEVGLDD